MITKPVTAIACIFLAVFSFQLSAASGQIKPYKGNLKQPDFTLKDFDGNTHHLSDYRGKLTIVQFWATYCTPCRKEMPTMNRLIKKMKDEDFALITINMAEDKSSVAKFKQEVAMDFPVLMDTNGEVLNQWKVFAAPANFIVDKQGEIRYTLYGAVEWDSPKMVEALKLLANQ